ncbi:MAG: hypothetical protein IJH32_02320 [Ruminococcus sp.]|nr:hypothetical protein [Ruminococcus sp.]
MAENVNEVGRTVDTGCSEPVCVDARRVYDSCGDKDCLADLRVFFTEQGQSVIDEAASVRLRDADVLNVMLDIEPVPFHRGFYSIDMTYFFLVTLDVFTTPCTTPTQVSGLCISSKKVILYGSEGSVRVFSSDFSNDDYDIQNLPSQNLPVANVQVAQPIALAASLKPKCQCHNCNIPCKVPSAISKMIGGQITDGGENVVLATLGVFSIVQLLRNVQMLLPSYDFCIPEKSCAGGTDSPCEMFSRLDFPTDEFFPPSVADTQGESGSGCGCNCNNNN